MTSNLPPNLLRLFVPRPPLSFLAPVDKDPGKKRRPPITGIAAYLDLGKGHDKDYVPSETVEERKKRKIMERDQRAKEALEKNIAAWDPASDSNVTADPYKTLFVGRLSYKVTEKQLRREFEQFGPILSLRMVYDSKASEKSKPRGYAFIEYERERDLTAAYREADGMKIDGRRIVVDVERGRTVKGWRPRRLGGGLGGTRLGGPDVNQRHSGRAGGTGGGAAAASSSSNGYGGSRHDERRGSGGYDDRRDDRRGSGSGYDDRRGSSGYGGDRRGGYDRDRRRSRSPGRDRGRDDRRRY